MWLNWSFVALGLKEFPDLGPDGCAWGDLEERAGLATLALFSACCCLGVKGDWAEFCTTLAFGNWAQKDGPCLLCFCTLETLYTIAGWSVLDKVSPLMDQDAYEEACDRCEHGVQVTAANHKLIGDLLVWHKKKGIKGRIVAQDIPAIGLLKGDRLEPSPTLPDIGNFEIIASYPTRVVFWRSSGDPRVKHRNPLFNRSSGISPLYIVPDLLHCWYLGLLKTFTTELIWEMMLSGVWVPREGRQQKEFVEMCCPLIFSDLTEWYKHEHEMQPEERWTRVEEFTASMFGQENKRSLALKAGELKAFFSLSPTCCPPSGPCSSLEKFGKQRSIA